MKNIILLTTVSTLVCACTSTKVDNHSVKYVTNYNTSVEKGPSCVEEPSLPSNDFIDPNDVSLEEIAKNRQIKALAQRKTTVTEYVEPSAVWTPSSRPIAPLINPPVYGASRTPRFHERHAYYQPTPPNIYVFGR